MSRKKDVSVIWKSGYFYGHVLIWICALQSYNKLSYGWRVSLYHSLNTAQCKILNILYVYKMVSGEENITFTKIQNFLVSTVEPHSFINILLKQKKTIYYVKPRSPLYKAATSFGCTFQSIVHSLGRYLASHPCRNTLQASCSWPCTLRSAVFLRDMVSVYLGDRERARSQEKGMQ